MVAISHSSTSQVEARSLSHLPLELPPLPLDRSRWLLSSWYSLASSSFGFSRAVVSCRRDLLSPVSCYSLIIRLYPCHHHHHLCHCSAAAAAP